MGFRKKFHYYKLSSTVLMQNYFENRSEPQSFYKIFENL